MRHGRSIGGRHVDGDVLRQVVATGVQMQTLTTLNAGTADLDKSECEVRQVQNKVLAGRREGGGHV